MERLSLAILAVTKVKSCFEPVVCGLATLKSRLSSSPLVTSGLDEKYALATGFPSELKSSSNWKGMLVVRFEAHSHIPKIFHCRFEEIGACENSLNT